MNRLLFFLGYVLLASAGLRAQSGHESLRAGDQEYRQENYLAAQRHYQDAVRQNPGSWSATYNLGCAEYQQGRFPEAEKAFQQAMAGAQLPAAKADAWYNLGNAQLKQHHFSEAITSYENSLRLRPGDAAAKQNLQMAKRKLQEEQQRQQQKKQQEEGQQPADDQKQSPPDSSKQSPPKPQPGQGQPQKSDEQPGQGEEPSPPAEPGKMTRQEAQRMLENTIGPADRKNARKYRAAAQPRKSPKANRKDW